MNTNAPSNDLQCWRLDLDRAGQSLILASRNAAVPEIVYCGKRLPDDENLELIARCAVRPVTPGTLDQLAPLSLLPEQGRGFPGQAGLSVFDAKGRPALTQFSLTDVTSEPHALTIHCDDVMTELAVTLMFECPTGSRVLKASTILANRSKNPYRVDWLSAPVLTVDQTMKELFEFAGRWTQEFSPVRLPITRGVHVRENKRGRTGHDHFAAMIFGTPGMAYTNGSVMGVHFTETDVHKMLIEELPDGRRQAQMGFPESRMLDSGESITSGESVWAFSEIGLNGLSHDFQDYVRKQVLRFPEPERPRPIHYNSWEAVYFNHDIEVLKDLASRAERIGAERFVLDDGWFGTDDFCRNDDTTSLGDWFVDKNKYPEGLTPLIEHVTSLGLTFGLWVEPEMVNLDSTLARQHPGWVMMHGAVNHPVGRQQHVLDLTMPAVTDYLFERMDWLLGNHAIDYVKWDMNRDITRPVDGEGNPLLLRQSRALRDLLARVRAAHPLVEIESCASGGGRIDYDVLKHTQRVWLSDSQDARVRWNMQNNAFLFLPPESYGSHVGPAHCHTSARQFSMSFRALVATTAHMGIEADLRELTADEESTLKRYTALFKANRHWLHRSLQYRLDATHESELSQLFVANDQSRFFLYSGTLDVPDNETTAPVRLTGLKPDARYQVSLLNPEDIDPLATRIFDSPLFDKPGVEISGAALMQAGLILPFAMPDSLFLVQGTQI